MTLRAYQPAFAGGELSPALWARVDTKNYALGLKTALNLTIQAHGGANNRAGLEYVGAVKDSGKRTRLIPFQFNETQAYVLEFGNAYIRFWRNGGLILGAGGAVYEVTSPYASDDLDELVFAQEADVMYIVHPKYPVKKLSRFGDNNWTLTSPAFAQTMTVPTGVKATATVSTTSAPKTYRYKVSAVSAETGEESAPSAEVTCPNDLLIAGSINRIEWSAVAGAGKYIVYRYADAGFGAIGSTTGLLLDDQNLAVDADSIPILTAPTGVAAAATSKTSGTGYKDHTYRYKVSSVSEATGEESLPSAEATCINDLSIDGGINTVTWAAVTGASKYVVYKFSNGSFGYVGSTTELTLADENITADTADGPQIGRNPFNGPGNYPRAVTFIQQRLALASTDKEPQAVYLSQTANYENFGYASPAKDSDAITFRMRARQVNIVRSMLAARYGLLLMTSSAEWVVTGGQASDAITPSAIVIANQGYRGAAPVQPINVGEIVLFAQRSGGVVRDFSYSYGDDAWVGKDLTIMSRHLFENRSVKAWAYAQAPSSIVWVVLDDGSLVSLTYMKEHEVWAWTRHESGAGAVFEDVTCIAEGGEDVPYFVVRRTIDGTEKRYIERLHSRAFDHVDDAFFVDCGLTYAGAAVSHLSGLSHLEGCEVVALADGNVVRGLKVEGGAVNLPFAAAKIHVGLPYAAVLQTLDLDLGSVNELGSVQGRFKSISKVVLRVEKTRGIFVGPKDEGRDSDRMVEFKQRSTEAWDEAIGLYTGDIDLTPAPDWNRAGGLFIKQFDPLPMSILALMPEVTLGR